MHFLLIHDSLKEVMRKTSLRAAAMSTLLMSALSLGVLSAPAANAAPVAPPAAVNTVVPMTAISDSFTKQTFDLINAERAKVGSRPFVWNQKIADVSQDWANHLGVATMDPNFDFANIHRTDAGGSLIPAGATWYRENIGFNFTPAQLVDWWMNSPGHKAAMLDPRGTDAGIGYVVPTSGPYAGWHLMVSNMAAYSTTAAPAPTTPYGKVLNAIDTSGNLWGYSAPGNTSLGGRSLLGSGWQNVKQTISVDWNSDGILDIVARWGNGYITMYAGIGNNDYKTPITIGFGGWENYEITATKLKNTDKYPGLVARDTAAGNLFYYPNTTGAEMNAGRTQIGFGGWTPMTEINALDWDKDGKMDLIVRNPNGELLLYRTDGNGNILNEARKVVDFGWNVMDRITAVPDFAGAGTVGFIARSTGGMLYYYGISGGKVQPPVLIGNGGWSGYKIASGSPRL